MSGSLRLGAVTAAVLTVLVGAATAATRPPALAVRPSSVEQGDAVVVRGSAGDCPVGDRVTLISRAFPRTHRFAGVPAVFARVRAYGRFSAKTTIPRTRAAGRYVITARCGGGNLGVEARLTVRR